MKCAARLPNDGSAAFPCAALVRAFAFLQRLPLGLPTPPRRARCIECASIVPCLPSRTAGRSPFKVCSSAVDVCFAFLTDFPRGRGRRGRRSRPKPSAALFRLSKLAEKLPRSVFRLRRASPPIHWICPCGARRGASPAKVVVVSVRLGQHRARPTGESARVSPRAAYASLRLFSRQLGLNGDAAGTLCASRENRSPVHWGRGGTMTVARVDDGRGAVGCLWRGGSIGPLGSLVSIGSVSIGKRR